MPQLSAYLSFDGNCAEAMRFYERVLGGRLDALVRYADAPADAVMPILSDEDAGRVMYARLTLDEQTLLGSDATAEGAMATTVAERGWLSSSVSSPKKAPSSITFKPISRPSLV